MSGGVRFADKGRDGNFTQVENDLLFDESLSIQARMAYILLSSYAWGRKTRVWPGQEGLAKMMGVTRKTIRVYINELVTAGLLRVERQGAMKTNVYVLYTVDHRWVEITHHDGTSTTHHDGDPTTHEEDEGEEDEEDGSSTRPFDDVLELRNSERTGPPSCASAGAREAPRLCGELVEAIVANGARRPTITKTWLDEARLLVDRDGIDPEDVSAAIRWATNDSFWRANILSMPTLRKRYDTLRLQAQRAPLPSSRASYDEAMAGLERMIEEAPA